MADEAELRYPFTSFNFEVEITLPGSGSPLVGASFSECDGMEMTMEVKTLREGGNNGRQIRLSGPVSYGQLVLKRGMTKDTDLWDWFNDSVNDPSLRATTQVIMYGAEPGVENETRRFVFSGCVPVKLKAPPLNAKDGLLAIEELQIAFESMQLDKGRAKRG